MVSLSESVNASPVWFQLLLLIVIVGYVVITAFNKR